MASISQQSAIFGFLDDVLEHKLLLNHMQLIFKNYLHNARENNDKNFGALFIYLFIHYLFMYLFIYLFIYLFVYLFIYVSIYLFIYLSIYLFIYLFIYHNYCLVQVKVSFFSLSRDSTVTSE